MNTTPQQKSRAISWITAAICLIIPVAAQTPIRLHPSNGHYFQFRGQPVVLVGSSEHYGALINLDFDYVTYLNESQARGLNLIRIFTGTYRENAGAFGIPDNTLAPPTSRTVVPWKRTNVTGAADGGNRFDLNQWDPAYFTRLRDLVAKAGERGIVAEVTFFSAIYDDTLWNLSPLNAANHVNGVGGNGRIDSFNPNGNLLPFQKALARKFVNELNGYDNVFYEVCNEPYNGSVGETWENLIVDELVSSQSALPNRHLIARNVFNYQGVITNPHPSVSIFNFHYALPNAATQNYGLNRVLGDDETGFAGQADFTYRREAWEFMLSGGGLFNNLDLSYTASLENGTSTQVAPAGGGPAIRRQLGVMRGVLQAMPLVNLVPQPGFVAGGVPSGGGARALGQPGESYVVYLRGGSQANLALNLPAGTFSGQWIDTKTGAVSAGVAEFNHAGGQRILASPSYNEDIALRVTKTASSNPNTAPVGVADLYNTTRDTTLVVPVAGVLANDTDAQSHPLTAARVSGPSNGTLTLNGNGGFTYVPNPNYTGLDSFTYQANDGSLNSNATTVSLVISAPVVVPPPPSPLPLPKLMPLGDSITRGTSDINYPNGSIPGGYRKELGSRLASAGLAFDFVGAFSDNAASGMDPDHNGINGFRTDHLLANLSSWLTVNPDIVLLHAGTNDILQDIPVTTAANNLELLINNITSGAPGRRLYVSTLIPIQQNWLGRTAAYLNGNVNTYNTRVRSLVAQYATLGRKVYLVEMNGSIVFTDPNPINNFYQPGDGLHPGQAGYNQMASIWFNRLRDVENFPPPVSGNQILTNGSFESNFTGWTAAGNQTIQSSAAYAATDGSRLVAFNTANSVPNGVLSQIFATTAGTTYTLTFDAGVYAFTTSPQRLQITVTGGSTLLSQVATLSGPGNGTSKWVRHTFVFTANSGSTTLTFRDLSASTAALDLILDDVVVTAAGPPATNVPPVATADNFSTTINTTLVVPANGVLANDTDAQGNTLTVSISTGPSRGSVTLNADGGFSYTPAAGITGTDSFTYRAFDGGLYSNVVVVNLLINPAATGPLVNGSFESGFTGWSFSGNQNLYSTAPYAATDGTTLVGFNGANLTPNAVLSQTVSTIAGQTYRLTFDLGVLSYNTLSQTMLVTVTGATSLLSRSITLAGSGSGNRWSPQSFTFVANSTSTSLTFRDQSATTNGLDLTLDNVRLGEASTAPNSAPVAVPDNYSTLRDIPLVVATPGVLPNDTDLQSDPLTAVIDRQPSSGTLTLTSSGGFTYTPAAGYTGKDSFTYHANDGRLDSNIATVTIIVTPHVATTLVNGSFESGYTGWNFAGNQGIQSAALYAATDGSKVVAFNGGNLAPNGTLSQSFATTAGRTYMLAFDAVVLAFTTASQTLQVTVSGSTSLLSRTINLTGSGAGNSPWQAQSFTFIADGPSATLTFRDQSASSANLDLLVDNVRLTAAPLAMAARLEIQAVETRVPVPQLISIPPVVIAPGVASLTGSPGNSLLQMTAPAAGIYSLERSEDLMKWEWLTEKQAAAGDPVEFHDTSSSDMPALFYRIGMRPAFSGE